MVETVPDSHTSFFIFRILFQREILLDKDDIIICATLRMFYLKAPEMLG